MFFRFLVSHGGQSVWVSATSGAAAERKGRAALLVSRDTKVKIRRSLNLGLRVGGMKIDDQLEMLTTYSQLLTSKTPKDLAYQKLGAKALPRNPGETVAAAFLRAGVHPVACAILSGAESAGSPGEGASRASDWLADRQQRSNDLIRPAMTQSFTSAFLILGLFAMPILCNKMFSILPGDIVQIQNTGVSEFLRNMHSRFYEPIGDYTVIAIVAAVLGSVGYGLTLLRGAARDRIPMLGPLTRMTDQERLSAWLSMYIPFHHSDLPYVEFVRAGRRAFKTGPLAESFRLLDRDVRAGEADSLATAAALHPEAVPKGLEAGLRVMADMNLAGGQKHLQNLLEISGREVRRLAIKALRQAKLARMIVIGVMVFTILMGVYLPLIESSSMPSF